MSIGTVRNYNCLKVKTTYWTKNKILLSHISLRIKIKQNQRQQKQNQKTLS